MSESSISLPSLLILAGLSFVLYRYIFGSARSGPGSSSSSSSRAGPGRRIDPAAVNQVASMFPQLDRRAIAWDLQRNGGNAQATVERMLMTGRLETPPPSFQPPGLAPPAAAAPAPAATSTSSGSTKSPAHPDLITRFNLGSRVSTPEGNSDDDATQKREEEEREAAVKAKGKSTSWSANKGERADLMRKRKEEMILQARRRMEEKDRREAKGKAVEKS